MMLHACVHIRSHIRPDRPDAAHKKKKKKEVASTYCSCMHVWCAGTRGDKGKQSEGQVLHSRQVTKRHTVTTKLLPPHRLPCVCEHRLTASATCWQCGDQERFEACLCLQGYCNTSGHLTACVSAVHAYVPVAILYCIRKRSECTTLRQVSVHPRPSTTPKSLHMWSVPTHVPDMPGPGGK